MAHATQWAGLDAARVSTLLKGGGLDHDEVSLPLVMGLDQHRAQITTEWIDLASGEISRARVRPADRAGFRRLLSRFGGRRLEVALEATTGWRFIVEELERVDAGVHLADPC